MHIIESWSPDSLGPGAPGILAGPTGARWDDVADGRGAYVQRARLRFGSSEGEGQGALNTPPNRRNASHLTAFRARACSPRHVYVARRRGVGYPLREPGAPDLRHTSVEALRRGAGLDEH